MFIFLRKKRPLKVFISDFSLNLFNLDFISQYCKVFQNCVYVKRVKKEKKLKKIINFYY